ncbi:MAG: hypothetical protein JNG88_09450 [Phycisphaerales bacterium]|nr:hypothetical protein [Phycisphaerales bacterium]
MSLDAAQLELVTNFRERMEGEFRADDRFASIARLDRPDGSTLASRFEVAPQIWLELAIRPFVPQVRVGIVTDDRWKSEDLEQAIEDSGDEMDEFVEFGLDSVGLRWPAPPVEHYRDQGKYYYFATPLEIASLSELASPELTAKVRKTLDGYYEAFRGAIERLKAPA